jgi:molecular chaperone DnaK
MQTAVTVHILQGERPMVSDNTSLGLFNLEGLPPAPRGVPKIEVTFDLDVNGILNVTAKDVATGKSQSICLTGSTRLPENEKQRMMKEAERYAEEDRRRREEAEKLNNADALCYQGERLLADMGERIPANLRGRIEALIGDTREAYTKRDANLAQQRSDKLKIELQEAGKQLYASAAHVTQPGPSTESSQTTESPSGRVVDAEYADVKH